MTDLDRALKDALVLGLENDATAEHVLRIAAPFIDRAFQDQNNRIEKLEAALRDIIDERGICGHCGQLATGEGRRSFVICDKTVLGFKGPCHWTPQDHKDVARKALEGKDD
jgi:hypothetical protein